MAALFHLRHFRRTSPTICRSKIRAVSINCSSSSIRAIRRRWSSALPAFPSQFLKAADLFTSIRKDGDMKKVATVIYAVGWTQHSFGTQIIRTAAMLQLLMGNVGRAGGGVNALRGHSNIQGATDMAGIFDILPGYLKMPTPADKDLKTYLDRVTPKPSKPGEWESFNYWSNTPKFMVSFLKAMYGLRPPRKTISPSTTCPRSIANTPGWKTGTTCTRARSRDFSPSA